MQTTTTVLVVVALVCGGIGVVKGHPWSSGCALIVAIVLGLQLLK